MVEVAVFSIHASVLLVLPSKSVSSVVASEAVQMFTKLPLICLACGSEPSGLLLPRTGSSCVLRSTVMLMLFTLRLIEFHATGLAPPSFEVHTAPDGFDAK